MSRGRASGYSLTNKDARVVLGMVARGDREHDIAAWFGVNQGRIAEVKAGDFGELVAAPVTELPPKGPPGVKGRRLRAGVQKAFNALEEGNSKEAQAHLAEAIKKYDSFEA